MTYEPNWNARFGDEPAADGSQWLESIGVPKRVVAALTPGVFEERPAIEVARAWLASRAGILVLSGTVGPGKSVAAGWALKNNATAGALVRDPRDNSLEVLSSRRRSGKWISFAELVEQSDFDVAFWTSVRKVDLLVIDEATAEKIDGKGRALASFTALLRARYDDARRTVITTNLPPAEWLRLYGEADGGRLRDRLREAEVEFGRPAIVAITGPSRRGRPPGAADASRETSPAT